MHLRHWHIGHSLIRRSRTTGRRLPCSAGSGGALDRSGIFSAIRIRGSSIRGQHVSAARSVDRRGRHANALAASGENPATSYEAVEA